MNRIKNDIDFVGFAVVAEVIVNLGFSLWGRRRIPTTASMARSGIMNMDVVLHLGCGTLEVSDHAG